MLNAALAHASTVAARDDDSDKGWTREPNVLFRNAPPFFLPYYAAAALAVAPASFDPLYNPPEPVSPPSGNSGSETATDEDIEQEIEEIGSAPEGLNSEESDDGSDNSKEGGEGRGSDEDEEGTSEEGSSHDGAYDEGEDEGDDDGSDGESPSDSTASAGSTPMAKPVIKRPRSEGGTPVGSPVKKAPKTAPMSEKERVNRKCIARVAELKRKPLTDDDNCSQCGTLLKAERGGHCLFCARRVCLPQKGKARAGEPKRDCSWGYKFIGDDGDKAAAPRANVCPPCLNRCRRKYPRQYAKHSVAAALVAKDWTL